MAWSYVRDSALDYVLKAEPRGLAVKLDVECVGKKGNKSVSKFWSEALHSWDGEGI